MDKFSCISTNLNSTLTVMESKCQHAGLSSYVGYFSFYEGVDRVLGSLRPTTYFRIIMQVNNDRQSFPLEAFSLGGHNLDLIHLIFSKFEGPVAESVYRMLGRGEAFKQATNSPVCLVQKVHDWFMNWAHHKPNHIFLARTDLDT